MQVAATTRAFHDVSFEEACAQMVDLGFDRLELCLRDDDSEWSTSKLAREPDAYAAKLREVTRLAPAAFYLLDDIDREQFRGLSRFAKLVKVTQITVPASSQGAPYNTEVDRLKDLVSIAGQEGVRVSLKTESDTMTADPHTAVELCQAVKELGLTLDPSYYMLGTTRQDTYDKLLSHTYHVHLRDSTSKELQVLTGLGELDYNRLIAQLQKVGYNRTLSIDLIPEKTPPETRGLEFRKLRMLLSSLL